MITLDQFKNENFAINCETKEISDEFLEFLDENQCYWGDSQNKCRNTKYKDCWSNTYSCHAYDFYNCSPEFYISAGFIILTPYDIYGFRDVEFDIEEWEAVLNYNEIEGVML